MRIRIASFSVKSIIELLSQLGDDSIPETSRVFNACIVPVEDEEGELKDANVIVNIVDNSFDDLNDGFPEIKCLLDPRRMEVLGTIIKMAREAEREETVRAIREET